MSLTGTSDLELCSTPGDAVDIKNTVWIVTLTSHSLDLLASPVLAPTYTG